MYLLEVDGVTEGVSECLSIKTGLLYLTKLKLVPTTFDSSSTPVADERSPALSAEPFVVVVILWPSNGELEFPQWSVVRFG